MMTSAMHLQSSQVPKFPKSESLGGDCSKGTSVLRLKIIGGSTPTENFWNLHFSNCWKCTVKSAILVFSCCLLQCYCGQTELTYRPTLHILAGERPEETGLKQENWLHTNRLNIGRSSVTLTERIRNSWALLKAQQVELPTRRVPMREKCSCRCETWELCACPPIDHKWEPIKMRALLSLFDNGYQILNAPFRFHGANNNIVIT